MDPTLPTRSRALSYLVVAALGITGLLIVEQTLGYTVFHTLAELFTIIIAAGVFMITWNARDYVENGTFVILGASALLIAGVDTLHMLSYQGQGLLPFASIDLTTQLWVAGRYVQSLALVVAALYAARKVQAGVVFWAFTALTFLLLLAIFTGVFPSAYVDGAGLTSFKVTSEYIVAGIMVLSILIFWLRRDSFDDELLVLLEGSILLAVLSEIAFTRYSSPTGPANLMGHLLRLGSFFLLYRAIIETALTRPFSLLFRELSQTSRALEESEIRFRTTFERATLGIAHVALDGSWIRVNHRLCEITGYTMDELLKIHPEVLTAPDDLAEEHRLNGLLLAGEIDEYRHEKRYVRSDGTLLWVSVNRTLMRDEEGQPAYYVAIVEDISAGKASEQRLRHQRDLNEALAQLDRAMNATFDVDEVLRTAMVEGGTALGVEGAILFMREGLQWVVDQTWNFPEPIDGMHFSSKELPHTLDPSRLPHPIAVDEAFSDERLNLDVTHRLGIKSLLKIPLAFRGQSLGFIYLTYHTHSHEFTEDEMDFAQKLATALALAVQNARLYTAERDTVDTLQEALLRIEDDIPEIDVATAYYSAIELTRIGGDFYDVFRIDDDHTAFVIGDVAGKGLEAAALTATAKSTIRAFAYEFQDPPRVVAAVNRSLSRQIDDSRFITAIYGVLDVTTGEARMACAGHPAPIVCDAYGCVEDAAVRNPPMAVFPDLEFDQYRTTLAPGQRMVLFSDGLIDARRGSDLLGEGKVREILDVLGDADPEVIVTTLLRAAQSHAGGHAPDDITILAFRFLGRQSA